MILYSRLHSQDFSNFVFVFLQIKSQWVYCGSALWHHVSLCAGGFWPEGARYPIFRIWGHFDGQDWLEWYQYSEEELLIVCCLLPVHSHRPCGRQSTPVCVCVCLCTWESWSVVCTSVCGWVTLYLISNLFRTRRKRHILLTVLDCCCCFPQTCTKVSGSQFFQKNLQLLWLVQLKFLFISQSGWIVQRECLLQAVSYSHSFKCSIFSLGCEFIWDGKMLRYLCLWAELYGSPAAVFLTCTEKVAQRVTRGDNPKQGCRQAATNRFYSTVAYQSLQANEPQRV